MSDWYAWTEMGPVHEAKPTDAYARPNLAITLCDLPVDTQKGWEINRTKPALYECPDCKWRGGFK